jgi:hypothetical protein
LRSPVEIMWFVLLPTVLGLTVIRGVMAVANVL